MSQKEKQPSESKLVTGVKRDISLLKQVDINLATSVTVLDISLEKNNDALLQLLENEVDVFYVDHHRTGEIPQSKKLVSILDTDANTCTSLLVNKHLDGEFASWAVAAAFGDNMEVSAKVLAEQNNFSLTQQSLLKELGVYVNYNGYGRTVEDLHFHPENLFNQLLKYTDPFVLINEQGSVFSQLKDAYLADMNKAKSADVLIENVIFKAVQLADEPWARRVSGVFGNDLANSSPEKAHAVVTLNTDSSYTVSLRAPLTNKQGAGDICANFPTGGGRAAAAGINALPQEMLSDFFNSVSEYYS